MLTLAAILAITGAQVIDATGAPPHRATVIVRDGKVAAVGAHLRIPWQCPTLVMGHHYALLSDPSFTRDPRLKYAKPSWRARWLRMTNDAQSWPAEKSRSERPSLRARTHSSAPCSARVSESSQAPTTRIRTS
jgi:hypothetical protein